MASSSSSSPPLWTYDVFLSFRGEDTRTNFVDHLYTALTDWSISTFKDDPALRKGKSVSPELLQAIEQSRFAVVVFSKNYADSSWCLDELVRIIDCKNSINQIVLPVFYDVDPSQVRKQTGCFGEAFSKHEINGEQDTYQIQRWRNALTEAASISGWDLPKTANGHESQCIKQIAGNILTILRNATSSNYERELIGMKSRIQNVKSLLLKRAEDEVQMVGIWGMGGVGKTTLARAVFNDISNQFDHISFVANVREVSRTISGLRSLQEQIISETQMQTEVKVSDVEKGIKMMRRLCHKKILLVLDDVDHVDQLDALIGKRDWFGKGSRIIITTRNEHLLVTHNVNERHRAVLLNDDEALLLFSRYAFKGKIPSKEYAHLSELVVSKVGGLPLALKILGCDLYGRPVVQWNCVVDKLMKHEPRKEILGVLKISYESLERNEQEIFLDIACFFLEGAKDDVSNILDCFGFNSGHGLSVLTEKCLVDVFLGKLQMHDMIKELAWDIIYQMNPKEPGKRSRLWRFEDIDAVLKNDTGTEAVEGIRFVTRKEATYNFKALRNMKKLRLLDVTYMTDIHQAHEPDYLSNDLCVIRWPGYPSASLPPCFRAEKLVHLDMQRSNVVQLWVGRKILDQLKWVDLSCSDDLTRTPDFSGAPNLEMLILSSCYDLKEVHPSLGDLQRLTFLDLQFCKTLECFQFGFNTTSLVILNLSHCEKLSVCPQFVGDMKRLKTLSLSHTNIEDVHPSIEKLKGLVKLDLSFCEKLRCLPNSIGQLKCLKTLNIVNCPMLEVLPEDLQEMKCIEELFLMGTPIQQPPSSILLLNNLAALSIGGRYEKPTYSLKPVHRPRRKSPDYHLDSFVWHNLSGFSSLKRLTLSECNSSEIPNNISQFINLETLHLTGSGFTYLPDSLCQLPRLKELGLTDCKELKVLPKVPPSLAKLLTDGCKSLESLGDLLATKHEFLHEVSFMTCFKLMDPENEQCSSKSSTSDKADIFIWTILQRRSIVKHNEFKVRAPGREIPEWFSEKLEGCIDRPCLELKLPPNWDTRIAGFAISCVKQHFCHPRSMKISLGHKYNKRIPLTGWWSPGFIHHHLWVCYMSLDYLGQLMIGDTYKKENYWVGGTDATFFRIQVDYLISNDTSKRYGIHVVYKDDLKGKEEDDCNTSYQKYLADKPKKAPTKMTSRERESQAEAMRISAERVCEAIKLRNELSAKGIKLKTKWPDMVRDD